MRLGGRRSWGVLEANLKFGQTFFCPDMGTQGSDFDDLPLLGLDASCGGRFSWSRTDLLNRLRTSTIGLIAITCSQKADGRRIASFARRISDKIPFDRTSVRPRAPFSIDIISTTRLGLDAGSTQETEVASPQQPSKLRTDAAGSNHAAETCLHQNQ